MKKLLSVFIPVLFFLLFTHGSYMGKAYVRPHPCKTSKLVFEGFGEPGRLNVPRRQQMHHLSNTSELQSFGSQSLGTIYLDNGVVKVGINLDWGGGVSEIVYQGNNIINNADTGRLIQLSLYDGGDYYPPSDWGDPDYGWNPVQGGDKYGHGSGVSSFTQSGSTIYTKCQPYEWNPDNKEGGPFLPVRSDCYFEQWVSLDTNIKELIKVTYKLTHFGTDEHLLSGQEFPCVYVNPEFNRMITYEGMSPWTNDAVSEITIPEIPDGANWYSPEYWGAAVNNEDLGLTIYSPWENCYPGFGGCLIPWGGTNYFVPSLGFSIGKGAVFYATIYFVVGNYAESREKIYALHQTECPTLRWEFNSNINWAEEWSPWNELSSFEVSRGSLKTSSVDGDPYMAYSFDISIPAESCPEIEIRMKASAGNWGDIYFVTLADTVWDENKSRLFRIRPGNRFETYFIDMINLPSWTGIIKQFRLDPIDIESNIEIDYIKLNTTLAREPGTAHCFRRFQPRPQKSSDRSSE